MKSATPAVESAVGVKEATPIAGPVCGVCAYGQCARPSMADSLFCRIHDDSVERSRETNQSRDAHGRFT